MDISVVIPTYNREEVLQRALASVYAQTYKPKEVIIIDDGSTDKTSQILKLFPDAKYYFQKNAGVSSARNSGIKKASYEWIAFLDSDDEWHRDKLQEHLELHLNKPKLLMSYTDEKWIRDAKEVKVAKKYAKVDKDIFSSSLSHCIIAPSSALMHKSIFDSVGLFDETLEVCEDYDIWLRVLLKHQIGLVNKKLITKYGGADDQLSTKFWGMDRFRVLALESLLKGLNQEEISCDMYEKKEMIKSELLKKYKLLLKGAIKHSRVEDAKRYEKNIGELS